MMIRGRFDDDVGAGCVWCWDTLMISLEPFESNFEIPLGCFWFHVDIISVSCWYHVGIMFSSCLYFLYNAITPFPPMST